MKKNIAGKSRKVNNPYASWTDPRTGWKYKLLKSWQADNGSIFARWFVDVHGYGHDLGDSYVQELRRGVLMAEDLVIDLTVWESEEKFLEWVK
jgi:hypothetical protein